MIESSQIFWGLLLNGLLAVAAVLLGAATLGGAACGAALGLCIFVGFGPAGFIMLAIFVATASAATRHGYARKAGSAGLQPSYGRRTARQAVANLFVAAACGLLVWASHAFPFTLAYLCAIGAALADTLSSELGQLYGRRPRLITTLRRVERGTDGAVSWQGLVDGAAGATLIALAAVPVMGLPWKFAWVVVLASVVGDLSDSVIGALMPRSVPLENELTNLLATGIGAATGGAISLWM